MAVFVDDMRAPFGNMIMCHMSADTHEELVEMADKIGVQRKWIQYEGTYKEHFDIAMSKRKLAVRQGAKEVETHEFGLWLIAKRENWPRCPNCKGMLHASETKHMPERCQIVFARKRQMRLRL